jgi:hypothetical protein
VFPDFEAEACGPWLTVEVFRSTRTLWRYVFSFSDVSQLGGHIFPTNRVPWLLMLHWSMSMPRAFVNVQFIISKKICWAFSPYQSNSWENCAFKLAELWINYTFVQICIDLPADKN